MLKFIYILCGLIECLWISADGNGVRANESITEARSKFEKSFECPQARIGSDSLIPTCRNKVPWQQNP